MTIFLVLANDAAALDAKVAEVYPEASLKVNLGQWLVSDSKVTTKDVSDKLGLSGGDLGQGLVTVLGTYYGWHNPSVWEWITTWSGKSD